MKIRPEISDIENRKQRKPLKQKVGSSKRAIKLTNL